MSGTEDEGIARSMGQRLEGQTPADIPRLLVVTNDFPPRIGGVQQYLWNLAARLPPDRLAVLAPSWPGWQAHDGALSFPVYRWPTRFLWPTDEVRRRLESLARAHRAEVVLFGHGFPLPVLAPALRARGLPSVALTHGVEVWVARTPGLEAAFRWAASALRGATAVSHFTAGVLGPRFPANVPLEVLHPGVDQERFSPKANGAAVRSRLGLADRPTILCVSRLVPRKGQDVLIRSMEVVRRRVPEAVLVIAGDGPDLPRLEALATEAPPGSVVLAGAVADEDLPATYAACDVFAMPCRTRWGGLEVEGFGIVFLEASATARPVVAGRSGGSEEAVVDEETGLLVEGAEPKAVALALAALLDGGARAARMGAAGRALVEAGFTWQSRAERLAEILRRAVA